VATRLQRVNLASQLRRSVYVGSRRSGPQRCAPAGKPRAIQVASPATGERIDEVPVFTRDQVRDAVALARETQRSWAALSFRQRGAMLKHFRDALLDAKEEVALTVCAETGKPEVEVYTVEIFYVCDAIGYWAKHAQQYLADQAATPHLLKTKRAYSTYKPRGVIGLVTPWNYPFELTIGEAIPALMAGNAVVIKPSEITPLSCLVGCRIAEEAGLPKGLLSAVTGYGETGSDLVDFVDMVAFTGSVATGRKIAVKCAEQLKPCSMELGGKDPMIVCRDADLERAANAAVWGSVTNAGQVCMAVERIYVDEKIYDPFVEKVVANTAKLRQGPPEEHADLGSMTSPPQIEKVEDHLRDAVAKGARILAGGKAAGRAHAVLDRAHGRRRRQSRHEADARRDVRPGDRDSEGEGRGRGAAPRQRF
jgi:acyl-CoA reductase-like NAD-dependent aldehyde dehydrogenase